MSRNFMHSTNVSLPIKAAIATFFLASSAFAQEVVLTSNDGLFSARGEFVKFENNIYTIKTVIGNIEVDAATVSCEGEACVVPEVEVLAMEASVPTAPAAAEAAPASSVVFAGSDTVGDELMPLLLAGYGANFNAAVEVTSSGVGVKTIDIVADEGYGDKVGTFTVFSQTSSAAFPALLDKTAEFGMASRRIKRDEARALAQDGAGSMVALEQEHIIAVDSLVVIVNPENPVHTLTLDNLAAIYRGDIGNWSELGGPDLPIIAYTRPDGSGTRATFEANVFGATGQALQATVANSNEDLQQQVISNPGALGYVGYAFVNDAQPVSLISSCGIESAANAFSAKTEEYPMQRRLYLYTRQDNTTEEGRQFLQYAMSSTADGVIDKAGYISLGIERISQDLARARAQQVMENTASAYELNLMREMVLGMYERDRLSSTFRFATGSNRLDRISSLDLDRLIEYLQNQPEGTKISLVGFTDSDGAFSANLALSKRRAEQVLVELQSRANGTLDHISFETQGFGELAPTDCNSSSDGKRLNRRVEVWIK